MKYTKTVLKAISLILIITLFIQTGTIGFAANQTADDPVDEQVVETRIFYVNWKQKRCVEK